MMERNTRQRITAALFIALFLGSGVGAGVDLAKIDDAHGSSSVAAAAGGLDDVERLFEGGGTQVHFADDMSQRMADHYEAMDYLEDGLPFDYYGGGAPTAGSDDMWAWQAERWELDPYRWGHEGAQRLDSDEVLDEPWSWSPGSWRFGSDEGYPTGAMAGLVTPVVDLRDVPRSEGLDVDIKSGTTPSTAFGVSSLFGLGVTPPSGNAQANASAPKPTAVLRLEHAYDFLWAITANGQRLVDGGRVEIAYLDSVEGWSSWQGIQPSSEMLRIGDTTFQGRTAQGTSSAGVAAGADAQEPAVTVDPEGPSASAEPGTINATADAWYRDAQAGSARNGVGFDSASGSPSTTVLASPPRPAWLYGGVVDASQDRDLLGGPWRGFGGVSNGTVESVFDLSAYAGHMVRMRFVTATKEANLNTTAHAGWDLRGVEVHAVQSQGTSILDLAAPGDGAILGDGASFAPVAVFENRRSAPRQATATIDIDGSTATEPLEIPPAGRVFHRFPAFDDIVPAEARPGLHRVDVSLTEREVLAPPPEAPVPDEQDVGVDSSTRTASFHFQLGGGSDWRVVSVDFNPISEERFGSDRLILPGTPAKIRVGLENLGPVDLTLDLGTDITPVLRDLRGEPVEAMQASAATIDLPVSRSVSGSLGQEDPVVFAEWTWDGTDDRQVLDLRVEDGNGSVRFDAGRVRVGAMEPEAMNVTFANTWDFDDGCIRSASSEGRSGVIQCRGWGNATSPIYKVDGGRDLLVGSRSNLRIMHHGGPVNATLLALNHSDYSIFNAAFPAEDDPDWTVAHNASLPESASWAPQRIPWHTFPTNTTTDQAWSGWIMLRFTTNATGAWNADEVRLEVGPSDRALPIVWETLDVGLHPQDGTLTSPSKQPMAWLSGRDGLTDLEACNNGSNQPCDDDPSGSRIAFDQGDIHQDGDQGLGSQSYAAGRVVQDSILRLEETIDLAGARPTLHFNHWLDADPGGEAVVEVARLSALSSSDAIQSATDQTPGSIAAADDAWQAVARYAGTDSGSDLRAAEVPLDAFAGEEVLIRFRYHIDPSTDFTEIPRGWFVDGVRVSMQTVDGIQEIPAVLTEAKASAGITLDDTFHGTPNGASGGDDQPVVLGFVGRDQCASAARSPNTYELGPTAITDVIDLRSASQPILTLDHWLKRPGGGIFSNPHLMIDLEYQVQRADGTWPAAWTRATPHVNYVPSAGGPAWVGQPLPTPGALPTDDGQPVMEPFIDHETWAWERFNTTFVLNKLAGEVVRFRAHAWTEAFWWAERPKTICEDNSLEGWHIDRLSIREPIHLTDAAVTGLNVPQDDSDLVSRSGGSQFQVPNGVQVLFQDDARVVVSVTNKGKLPVALNVTLGATPRGDTEPPAMFFIDDFTNPDNPTPTFNPWGFVPEIAPGESVQVRFQADFTTTEPGAYDLNAVARTVGAVDTKPANDAASQTMLVQPLRALSVDPATTIEPFIGVSSSQRNLTVVLRNEGNVREREVLVEATLLRMTSLTEGVPVEGVALPSKLATQLDARVGVTPPDMLRWNLDPAAAGLTPDESYAIEVRVTPEPGSARMSLPDGSTQPLEPADGVLLDLTDIGKCANVEEPGQGCRLVRFLVEDHLFGTDFTPANSTSAVPGILPVDEEGVLTGWTATTRVRDGEGWIEVEPGERPGVPSWMLGNATDVAAMPILRDGPAVEGGATGKVWYVPPYDGLEDVENELRSPVLPGHIIDDASRGIVDLRYASGLEEGQADLEVRTLEGGAWSEWMPSSSTRAGRVAVVLPPDFPRVQRSDIGPGWTANSNVIQGLGQQSPNAERDVTVFPLVENGVEQWHLIAGLGGNSPRFWGYTWNPSLARWSDNNTIVEDLSSQSYAAPAAFDLDGETYLLIGASNGVFEGFRWTASGWVEDDSIETGLQSTQAGYSDPVVFHLDDQAYLIAGSGSGQFDGYRWDGTEWVEESNLVAGLPLSFGRGAPAVFHVQGPDAGTYIIIGGRTSGSNCPQPQTLRWAGTGWTAAASANPVSPTSLAGAPSCSFSTEFRPATLSDPVDSTYLMYGSTAGVFGGQRWSSSDVPYPNGPVPGHPIPPYYNEAGLPVECDADPSTPSMDRCIWSPLPSFHPAGDVSWVRTLATVLGGLADALGDENVAVFTTDGPDLDLPTDGWPSTGDGVVDPLLDLGLNRSGHFLNVHCDGQHCDPDRARRSVSGLPAHEIAMRPLGELGTKLDTYGGILLLGGNTTTTFADQSTSLVRMSYTPPGAVARNTPLDQDGNLLSTGHHETLFAILQSAQDAGVRVLGAAGPAVGTLGLSSAAAGAQLATDPVPPDVASNSNPAAQFRLRCALERASPGSAQNQAPKDPVQNDHTVQPNQRCMKAAGNGWATDWSSGYNYEYFSQQDAQNMAVVDFVLRGGGTPVPGIDSYNNCPPWQSFSCTPAIPTSGADVVVSSPTDLQTFVTMRSTVRGSDASPSQALTQRAAVWVQQVLHEMEPTPNLPAGTDGWEHLDPAFGAPLGGTYFRDDDGRDHFDGRPVQFRLVVRSTPDDRGHDGFVLDRVDFYGTPRTSDLGVRIVEPRDLADYTPGDRFVAAVEVSNRGTEPIPDDAIVEIQVTQDRFCPNAPASCLAPAGDLAPRTVIVQGPIPAGAQYVVPVGGKHSDIRLPYLEYLKGHPLIQYVDGTGSPPFFGAPFFHRDPALDRSQHDAAFTFTATLTPPSTDEESLDDVDTARAFGRQVLDLPLVKDPGDVFVAPNEAAYDETESIEVGVRLANHGSNRLQQALITYDVRHADPNHCYERRGATASDVFNRCQDNGLHVQTPFLTSGDVQGPISELVPHGTTREYRYPIDLVGHGIGPGTYRIRVNVTTLDADGNPLTAQTETFQRWVHLAHPSVEPDGGLAASGDDLSDVTGDTTQLADQDTQDAWLAFQSIAGSANQGATCSPDSSTTDMQNRNNVLLHGWRMGDDGSDTCATGLNLAPDAAPALEWRRSPQRTIPAGGTSCSPNPCNVNGGLNDFGPDWIVWDPHCEGQVISGGGNDYGSGAGPIPCGGNAQVPATNEPNGIPVSLATFEDPVLTFDTRYQAAPRTGYLVEMRLPVFSCSGKTAPNQNAISGCSWLWNWSNDTAEWFPLQNMETRNPFPVTQRVTQGQCSSNGGPPTCRRPVSNPVAGLPGIWGGTTETGNTTADGGWKTMRFQVDLNAQAHAVRNFRNPTQSNPTPSYAMYRGLASYCQTIQGSALGDEAQNSMGWWPAGSVVRPLPGLEGCLYYQGEEGNIPRPVQFRFRAASSGADAGVNFWKIRDVHLTEHHLTVEGSDTIPVEMQDGEIRIIPVRVRNDGSVDDHVQLVRHFDDDPVPPVCGSGDEGDLTMEFGIRGGFSKRPTDDPQPSVDVMIPRDSSRVVWFHLDVGLDTGAVPHLPYPIPIVVEACSLRDPLESTRVLIDATYTAREWGDLVVSEAKFSSDAAGFSDTGGVVHAAEKVPLDVVVKVSNQGHKAVGGPQAPVPVRLVVDRLNENGDVVETFIADTKSIKEEIGTCVTCGRYATLQWIPDSVGAYTASVEVNRPAVVPENIPDNNRLDPRFVQVGRVPLPDLDITDAGLVPFRADSGCAGLDESVDRALQGHSYCIAAVVENLGPTCALDPVVEFRIDADLFSTRRDPLLPACFPAEDQMVVHSAPWQAVTPLTSDLTWRFFIDADSKQESNLTNNQHDFRLRVDRIRLEVPDDPIDVALLPGAQTILTVNLTNSGTAPATPVALVEGGNASVRVHAVQPPPLQVGETARVEVVVAASRSIAQGAEIPEVVISTHEDAKTHVVLPLRMNVSTSDAPQAAVLPLRSAPGATNATIVLDNAVHPAPLRWSLVSATTPLQANGTLDVETPAYGRELAVLPVAIAPHTPPGFHQAAVRLRAQGPEGHALEFDVAVPLVVEAQARFQASIDPDAQRVPRGLPGSLQATIQNTGNVPLDVRWNATIDSGTVMLDHHIATLEAGAEHPIFLDVENGQALRSVGELRLQWRNATEGFWQDGGMHRWSITFPPHAVEISSTDLASLKVHPGANQVTAMLTNPLSEPVEAEVLLVVDDQVHDRAVAEVVAGQTSRVALTFSAGSGGSGHDVLVVARPVGTTFMLQDDAFYDVGDARSRHIEVADDRGPLGIPGPAAGAVLLAVAAAVALRRRHP